MGERMRAWPARSFSRVVRRATLQLAAALIAFRGGAAQDLAQAGARLIDAYRAADAAHDSVTAIIDSVRLARVPRDSMTVGGIRLRFRAANITPSTRAVLDHAAPLAWARTQAGLGDAALRVAATTPVIVTEEAAYSRFRPATVTISLPASAAIARTFPAPISEPQAEDAILEILGTVASFHEPTALKVYAGEWMPAAPLSADSWEAAAIDLAVSNSSATRDCFAGAITRCESALGLTDVKDPLTEWYSPEDQRVLVARSIPHAPDSSEERALRERCFSGAAPDVCEMLARERPVPRPLTTDSRRTVIALALELGGPKAYDRLTSAKGSALEILAAASGRGSDDLMAEWRKRVLASTPNRVRPSVLEGGAMLAWTFLFGVAAARRRP
jgi:hypothetical protein